MHAAMRNMLMYVSEGTKQVTGGILIHMSEGTREVTGDMLMYVSEWKARLQVTC